MLLVDSLEACKIKGKTDKNAIECFQNTIGGCYKYEAWDGRIS